MDTENETVAFADFGLDPRLVAAVAQLGFKAPTPIQAEAIPHLLQGKDVVGGARTGSGKTAAFGLPILEKVKDTRGAVRALVIAPTRELALQVTSSIEELRGGSVTTEDGTRLRAMNAEVVTVYGGASYTPQLRALRKGVPIVVGTPGRLIDHLEKGSLDLSKVEIVVLDEADEMLRMGFIEAVQQLLDATPETRQVALFSATMPPAIRRVADRYLKDPVNVQVESQAMTSHHIEQRWMRVPQRFKLEALVRVLRSETREATLVFARTRAGCGALAEALAEHGFGVDALHGDLGQQAREFVVNKLRSGVLDVVVATDVAARGIDVDCISHVVNFDLPEQMESYVHRIGRTGRAGRKGVAISFATPSEHWKLRPLRRRLGVDLEEVSPPSDAQIAGQQRKMLVAAMQSGLDEDGAVDAVASIPELLEATGWSVDELAATCLKLLASGRGVGLGSEPETRPPHWWRPPPPDRGGHYDNSRSGPSGPPHRPAAAPHRASQSKGRHNLGESSGPRAPQPHRGREAEQGNQVEVFVSMGKRRGLRPQDVVGALTNEAGVEGHQIGRITILDNKTFVGMSPETAAHVLRAVPKLVLRGVEVRLSAANPRAPGPPQ